MEELRALENPRQALSFPDIPALERLRLTTELGNYREAHQLADSLYGAEVPGDHEEALDLKSSPHHVEAQKFLLQVASKARVIMVNEAHHVPQHRAFVLGLLPELRSRGFKYLAAEALFDSEADLDERGYPLREIEGYVREPVYGDVIRAALRLGYRVVPYEAAADNDRELGQAVHLTRRIPFRSPEAKALLLAGYSHIDKSGEVDGKLTMAQRFAELTGLEPFAVDQTVMTEHSAPCYEHPLYREFASLGLMNPVVFSAPESQAWSLEPAKWDATVFHPRSSYRNGRPTWLRLGGLRQPFSLPRGLCDGSRHCLVRARLAAESPGAVPIDQIEVVPTRELPVLLLPEGSFEIEAHSPTGELLARLSTTIVLREGRTGGR